MLRHELGPLASICELQYRASIIHVPDKEYCYGKRRSTLTPRQDVQGQLRKTAPSQETETSYQRESCSSRVARRDALTRPICRNGRDLWGWVSGRIG